MVMDMAKNMFAGRSSAQPLAGKRVLVTRARAQAGLLSEALRRAGAVPVEVPVIRIDPCDDYSALDSALRAIRGYDWAAFTSVNTLVHVGYRLECLGLTWHAFEGIAVAAVGSKTADALRTRGVAIAYMPPQATGRALADGLPLAVGQRVLLPDADIADRSLADALRGRGAFVDEFTAYHTTPLRDGADELRMRLASAEIDAVTFASSSSVHNLCAALGDAAVEALGGAVLACIGPVTAQAARACGLHPRVIASEQTIEGLVEALEEFFARNPPA